MAPRTGARRPGDPNALGNGHKNILASLEASLRRLQTDYIDVYWLHVWEQVTPVEEVMSPLDTLVRSGKVRAIGLSDVPVWYATKAQMLAQTHESESSRGRRWLMDSHLASTPAALKQKRIDHGRITVAKRGKPLSAHDQHRRWR